MTLFWAAAGRCADGRAAPIVQFHRQDVLERRAGQAALRERSSADDQQAAAAFGDEVGGHRQLRAREEIALDVGDDQTVVRVQIFAARREAVRQRGRAGRCRLDEEGVLSLGILALAADRIDFQAGSRAQARFMKLCSNPGAPSMIRSRRLRPAGLTSTLRALFSATASDSSAGISTVYTGRVHRIRRDREHLLDRRAIRRRHDAAALELPAVRQHAKLKRRPAEPRADRGHVQIDGRLIQPLIAGRHGGDLMVADPIGRSQSDGEHRRTGQRSPPRRQTDRYRRRRTAGRCPRSG